MNNRERGFTLVELMIIVAIIGILAVIAIPKFSDLIRISQEGATKGNLGTIRSAISVYYADNEGNPPHSASSLLPRYLSAIPMIYMPNYHYSNNTMQSVMCVCCTIFTPFFDNFYQDWYYDANNPAISGWNDPYSGQVFVGCTHTDSKGTQWTSY